MGVTGLWTVVQPCARPTNLATLNRKRLAVDASIWIYQFLKAVRDKEGNALRNSHVVGFFRRICKLLWFGILPVFVFDGGAPALKRATIQARARRREGRRDDAVRTAGKLLAVQMHRAAADENDRRKREEDRDVADRELEVQEQIPEDLTYRDELGMSQQEKQQSRKFFKKDAYHLPELDRGIAAMGQPDDPRIMSVEELEDYARQFHNGEDVNLYDFSKIDFNGDFFKSLPAPDRYNILNAARLRSRLRMGHSKEQLDSMFPDRMAFSRFQIERVKERNHLTQRLMAEVGMTGLDLTLGVNGRVAGEKDREYILVKNEGVEGGWALGVVSKEKDIGEEHKPIDVDAIDVQFQTKEDPEESEDGDFEDVPIEGLNRLPKLSQDGRQTRRINKGDVAMDERAEESLFVGGANADEYDVFDDNPSTIHPDEEDDISRAIALSLRNQHGAGEVEADEDFEDVPMVEPEWTQKQAEAPKPIAASSGSMIAHIVNNRANAAVPKYRAKDKAGSDDEDDMHTLLAKSRRMKKSHPKPAVENKKNPFDGPLPFPKLNFGASLFGKKKPSGGSLPPKSNGGGDALAGGFEPVGATTAGAEVTDDDEAAGGFDREQDDDGPKELPPWLADETDIRESLKKQKDAEKQINAEDREEAEEGQRLRRRDMRHEVVQVDSSDEDDEDIEIIDAPPTRADIEKATASPKGEDLPDHDPEKPRQIREQISSSPPPYTTAEIPEDQTLGLDTQILRDTAEENRLASPKTETPEPEFEDVPQVEPQSPVLEKAATPSPISQEVPEPAIPVAEQAAVNNEDEDLFADVEYDELSDPGDEELMVQMAEEAEEHARFASELNHKPAEQNREDYEKELRGLRSQQKKDRRDADEVTQVMVTECQALLRLFGIPYITAPMEAEAQCAQLVTLGLVDGIVTDDSDTFLFGGTRVYKNMFNSNKFVECYIGQDLETELSLSREQLISLAQLLGSDYTEGLPGVGPVTAVEILSEFPGKNGLEEFRDWWKSVQGSSRPADADLSTPFRKKFRKSQGTKLFLPAGFPSPAVYDAYLHPEVDASAENFQWGIPDVEGLRRFLMATIGWGKERTDEVLVPVIRDMNQRDREGTQANITRFFGGGVGVGAKEAFAPRQRGQGSKRMAAAVDKLRANVAGEGSRPEAVEAPAAKKRKTRRGKAKATEDAAED